MYKAFNEEVHQHVAILYNVLNRIVYDTFDITPDLCLHALYKKRSMLVQSLVFDEISCFSLHDNIN